MFKYFTNLVYYFKKIYQLCLLFANDIHIIFLYLRILFSNILKTSSFYFPKIYKLFLLFGKIIFKYFAN